MTAEQTCMPQQSLTDSQASTICARMMAFAELDWAFAFKLPLIYPAHPEQRPKRPA
jgi:hypothetical protein